MSAMVDSSQIIQDIEAHNDICSQLMEIIQQENKWLSTEPVSDEKTHDSSVNPSPDQVVKQSLLEKLSEHVAQIQAHRATIKDHQRQHPDYTIPADLSEAIGRATELIMRMVALDRENEKWLLKKGMVPNTQIPSTMQYRPIDALKAYQRFSS
jgi:flagellar biosynthesis/type III secretory pathway chaperone